MLARPHHLLFIATLTALTTGCSHAPARVPGDPKLRFAGESHLDNIRQLTHGGSNTEARWSFDGAQLVFQHHGLIEGKPGPACDQTYLAKSDGSLFRMLSNGKGRTASGTFLPGNDRVIFGSTFGANESCPPRPDPSLGYVLSVDPNYLLYSVKTDASDLMEFEPAEPRAYNAGTGVCKDGSVIFSSDRDGDIELYRGGLDRLGTLTDILRITRAPGYEGRASFSSDCLRIVWSATRPQNEGMEAYESYLELLKKHLVRPDHAEIWVANADGSHARQVTRLGATSFAPVFSADGTRILFASNARAPQDQKVDLYEVRVDGTRLERMSDSDAFDAFPAFSPDGKTLAFSSSRFAAESGETNIFLADWIEGAPPAPLSVNDADPTNRFAALTEKLSAPKQGNEAENFVADRFANLGLKPFFKEGGFAQKVERVVRPEKRVIAAHNIAGTWGNACGKMQPTIVGAHLVPAGRGADGASGVAALLEAVRWIQASGTALEARSCFVFAVFSKDESDSAGSSRFAAALKERKMRPRAMLNIDSAGNLENAHLLIFESESAKEWQPLLVHACAEERVQCGDTDSAKEKRPNDAETFNLAGVPTLNFFTGPHDNHFNATGGVQISRVVAAIAEKAASPRQRLHYQKTASFTKPALPAPSSERPSRGAYLGTIPDYAAIASQQNFGESIPSESGVHLAGARPGSPASKAGVKRGDILQAIEMPPGSDGQRAIRKLRTLEDYMSALESLNPGDSVILHLRRGAQELTFSAEAGKREP